jgi:hypothetical protein
MLIDVAISEERIVINKEVEKFLKHKNLTTETQRIWNVKTKATPVIIDKNGTISLSFRQYLSNVPGYHNIKELHTCLRMCSCNGTKRLTWETLRTCCMTLLLQSS